jgi:hypothetical protein
MGPEILIPAAIGAVSSAAMGKSPITGALLGGVTGGIADKMQLGQMFNLGSKAVETAAPTATAVTEAALPTTFMNEYIPSSLLSNPAQVTNTAGEVMGANLAKQGASMFPMSTQPATFTDGVQDVFRPKFEDIARGTSADFTGGGAARAGTGLLDTATNYATQNPLTVAGAGKSILDVYNQADQADKQRLQEAVAMGNRPITQGKSGPMAGNLLQVKRIG